MPVPGHQTFMRPLLEFLSDGGEHGIKELYAAPADRFALTEEDRQELIPSGTQRLLDNRVGWAKTYLLKAGLLSSPRRAVISLTDRGREALAATEQIDNRYLRRFPEFVEFLIGDTDAKTEPEPQPSREQAIALSPSTERTPEELIEAGYRQIHNALAADLLDRVKASSPPFFEHLVIELLVKMGYGGSLDDAGKAIGKPGDAGIDGIIKEDRLGLDAIYVQAKKWENTVGRPDIQQFAGALQGQRARKGVFITTATFSSEARQYASMIEARIVLIDGPELARLMIAHGVGVTPVAVYELKRVDSDYFTPE